MDKIHYGKVKEDQSPEAIENNRKLLEEIVEEIYRCSECDGEGWVDIGGIEDEHRVRCPFCNSKEEEI